MGARIPLGIRLQKQADEAASEFRLFDARGNTEYGGTNLLSACACTFVFAGLGLTVGAGAVSLYACSHRSFMSHLWQQQIQSGREKEERSLSMNEDEEDAGNHRRSAAVGWCVVGSMVAITLSGSANHSILWMILHGICSWFYVIYYAYLR